jgi:hypothetical protein
MGGCEYLPFFYESMSNEVKYLAAETNNIACMSGLNYNIMLI